MSQLNAENIDDFVTALRAETVAMPDAVRARLAARLTMASAPVPQPSLPAAPARAAWRSPQLLLAVAIPLSGLLGAAAYAWLQPAPVPSRLPAPSRLAAPSRAPLQAAAPERSAMAVPSALVASPEVTTRRRAGAVPSAVSGASSGSVDRAAPSELGKGDLELLEQARSTLAEGNGAGALELLRAHRQRFPASSLAQEREAVTVRALFAAGRVDEAREKAKAFSARYPQSPLGASLTRLTGANP